jgi:hypothetical protein
MTENQGVSRKIPYRGQVRVIHTTSTVQRISKGFGHGDGMGDMVFVQAELDKDVVEHVFLSGTPNKSDRSPNIIRRKKRYDTIASKLQTTSPS